MKTEILVPSLKNSFICVHDVVETEKGTECDWHMHTECEMMLVIEGEIIFGVGDEEYELHSGDIIFVNENVPHKTVTTTKFSDFLMQMRYDYDMGVLSKHLYRYINHKSESCAVFRAGTAENIKIRQCADNIIKENTEREKSYDLFIKAEISKIFAYLYRYGVIKDPTSRFDTKNISRILPVLEYVDENYSQEISLAEVSNILNVDKAHFCRVFKKAVNMTFVQYLNFVRVLNAERLLLSTDKSMTEIAQETGFSSHTYFVENFKHNMGVSPARYKKIKQR